MNQTLNNFTVVALLATSLAFPAAPGAAAQSRSDPQAAFKTKTPHSHHETGSIGKSGAGKAKRLSNFCLDAKENILSCDEAEKVVRVIAPDNRLLATWKLAFPPQAIGLRPDGAVVVAGSGQIAVLDKDGKPAVTGTLPVPEFKSSGNAQRDAAMKSYMTAATCVACSGQDVFVSARANTGYTIYRMTGDLKSATPIISGLRGCCGQMCFAVKDGAVYVAANCQFQVVKYDRDGKKLGAFGQSARGGDEGFSPCCNPMGLAIGPKGELWTSEASVCRVKRYSEEGKLLGIVGCHETPGGCRRMTIAITKDGSRVYCLDNANNFIRVLTARNGGTRG